MNLFIGKFCASFQTDAWVDDNSVQDVHCYQMVTTIGHWFVIAKCSFLKIVLRTDNPIRNPMTSSTGSASTIPLNGTAMKADVPPTESAHTSLERARTCTTKNSIRVALPVGVSDKITFGVSRTAASKAEE